MVTSDFASIPSKEKKKKEEKEEEYRSQTMNNSNCKMNYFITNTQFI